LRKFPETGNYDKSDANILIIFHQRNSKINGAFALAALEIVYFYLILHLLNLKLIRYD